MSASKGRESARRRHIFGKTLLILALTAGPGLLALEGLIWKAICKVEGSWDLSASLLKKGGVRGLDH